MVVALGRSAMPPKRKIGEAARAKRKELAETTTLNLDMAGASDALATEPFTSFWPQPHGCATHGWIQTRRRWAATRFD